MSSHVNRTIGLVLGTGLMAGAFVWGNPSVSTSHASSAPPSPHSTGVGTGPTQGFAEVAKRVTPAVVNITTVTPEKVSRGLGIPDERRDRLEEFFGKPFEPRGRGPQRGQGSGVIISSDGYILTNNHVIANARDVNVTLPDKREFKGRIVGTDPKSDLAVVKINATHLPAVMWGDASVLQVGEYVLAVGNPFGLNSTVTLGIVSALGRGHMGITQYEDFIQTDAAINPGNSGGALVNTKGELIGINTAIFSQTGGYQGVGFAVSTTMAKPIYESLVSTGKVVRGYLGVGIQDLNQELAKLFKISDGKGALISDVKDGSPADLAGLQQGDVVIEYQGAKVEDGVVLQRFVTRTAIGTKVSMKVIRDGHERDVTVRVGEQPNLEQIAKVEVGEGEDVLSGISIEDLGQDSARELGLKGKAEGVVVTKVQPDSQAERAGLMPGDVIHTMNRQPIKSVRDFAKISSHVKKGEQILILISRQGNSLFLSVKV